MKSAGFCVRLTALAIMIAFLCALVTAQTTFAGESTSPVKGLRQPILEFSSRFPNSTDRINAVQVGKDRSVYVAGVTLSAPTGLNPNQQNAGEGRAFIAKISPDGSRFFYFTYISNTPLSEARALAIDAQGNAYVAGETYAQDFPVVAPLQSTCKLDGAGRCAGTGFVAKLDASGKVVFATYLGGSNHDEPNSIAVDRQGAIIVVGYTQSLDFPIENALQTAASGNGDGFVAAVAPDGSHLLFSTYLGGSEKDEIRALALDAAGNIYLTGRTNSLDFPTEHALQEKCRTQGDGQCAGTSFITAISVDGKALLYSTYLGGSGGDSGNALTVDGSGNVYVAGVTSSKDFPTANARQAFLKGQSNAFIAAISPQSSTSIFSTYFGGSAADQANTIALDNSGNVVISGWTDSPDFPTQSPIQASCNLARNGACSLDGFATVLTRDGSNLRFSTYLGGSGSDLSHGAAVDSQGSAYLGGWTSSRDFISAKSLAANGASAATGGAFVVKISGLNGPKSPGTCTENWTGAAGDNEWNDAGNWNPPNIPASSDSVCIASNFSSAITIGTLSSANQKISSLTAGAPISLTSGPLSVAGSSTFSGGLTVSGGTLTLDGTASATNLTVSGGTLNGTGTVSVSDTLTLSSGTFSPGPVAVNSSMMWSGGTVGGGGLTVAKGATLTVLGNQNTVTLATKLNNQGTVAHTPTFFSATLLVENPAVINNSGSWTVNSTYSPSITVSGTVAFNNTGSFIESGGTGTVAWSVPISGPGSINVQNGTLNLNGSSNGAITGAITVGTGAVLDYGQGGILDGKQITGTGTFVFTQTATVTAPYTLSETQIVNGTISFNGTTKNMATFTNLILSGGTLGGSAPMMIAGSMTWSGGTVGGTGGLTVAKAATLTIQGNQNTVTLATTLNNQGTVAHTPTFFSATLSVENPAAINNSGSWTVNSTYSPSITANGTVAFNNTGSLVQSNGTGTVAWSVPVSGAGSINVVNGTLNLNGSLSGTITGAITVGTGAVLDYGQGGILDGKQITGTGTFVFTNSATVMGTYSLSETQITNGTISFNGATAFANLTLSGGTLAGSGAMSVTASMTWSVGTVGGTGGLTIAKAATLTIQGNQNTVTLATTLNNQGTVAHTPTFFSATLSVENPAAINNSGSWTVNSTYSPSITANGTVVFNNTGTLVQSNGTGTVAWSVPVSGTGSINVQNGTLNLNGSSSGAITGAITVGSGAVIQYGQGGTLDGKRVTGTGTFVFTNTATVMGTYSLSETQITNGTISFNGATTFANLTLSGGTLAGSGAMSVTASMTWSVGTVGGTGGLTIAKAATLTILGNQNTVTLATTLNNQGTVAQTPTFFSATLSVENPAVINNSGSWTVNSTYSPTISPNGAVAFNNTGSLVQSNGTGTVAWSVPVSGAGSINVVNGTLNLNGSLSGTITGAITVGSGAVLNYGQGGTLGASVSGAGTLAFTQTTTISSNYNFTGTTNIQNGTVTFSGTTTFATLNVTGSGGTLSFSAPGVTIGTLTLTAGTLYVSSTATVGVGVLTLSASATLGLELGSGGALLTVGGDLNLAGTVALSTTTGYGPTVGTIIPVIAWNGYFGNFNGITGLGLSDGDPLTPDFSSSGFSVTVDSPPADGFHRVAVRAIAPGSIRMK